MNSVELTFYTFVDEGRDQVKRPTDLEMLVGYTYGPVYL